MHVVINARCSWLHGDVRGFRDRRHRKHSSGDYKNSPPIEENANLRAYFRHRSGAPVYFAEQVRLTIARAFVQKILASGHRIIACAVAARHLHCAVEFPNYYQTMKYEIGRGKQRASHAVRSFLTGTIWAAGGEFKRIRDKDHFDNTYRYIRTRQKAGTIVWSHHPDENGIAHPELGAILMVARGKSMRIYAPSSDAED